MVPILVLLTILLFVAVDVLIASRQERKSVVENIPDWVPDTLPLPLAHYLHEGHAWAKFGNGEGVSVGIDDFIRRAIGQADRMDLRDPGEVVRQGEAMLSMVSAGHELAVRAPVSGEIVAVNPAVQENPRMLLDDVYGDGWIYRIRPNHLGEEVASLRLAERARSWLDDESRRFTEWLTDRVLAAEPAASLPDGGLPVVGVLARIEHNSWDEFEQSFLAGRH